MGIKAFRNLSWGKKYQEKIVTQINEEWMKFISSKIVDLQNKLIKIKK